MTSWDKTTDTLLAKGDKRLLDAWLRFTESYAQAMTVLTARPILFPPTRMALAKSEPSPAMTPLGEKEPKRD